MVNDLASSGAGDSDKVAADIRSLQSDIDRWMASFESAPLTEGVSTVHYGPVGKATDLLEGILAVLTSAIAQHPGGGAIVTRIIPEDKRPSLGDRIEVLKLADKERVFGRRLLKRPERVQKMVQVRNNWAHGRGERTIDEARTTLEAFRAGVDDLLRIAEALQDPT